jgi:rhodanese-related sulfurtransferase
MLRGAKTDDNPPVENGPGSGENSAGVSTVTREQIRARLQDPSLVLVNVMPKETFEAGHIPRSINLPVAAIEEKARQQFPDLKRELTIYCSGPT